MLLDFTFRDVPEKQQKQGAGDSEDNEEAAKSKFKKFSK